MMSKIKKVYIFALAAHGKGLSGGDRIFIEFARRWSKKFPVTIYVWEEGAQMLQRQHLGNSKFQIPNSKQTQNSKLKTQNKNNLQIKILKMGGWCKFGFVVCYFARIIRAIIEAFRLTVDNKPSVIVYSASEFWMDSLPAFILKLRFPKVRWIASWYQTAPNPLKGFTEGEMGSRDRMGALVYWLIQFPIKPIIDRFADFVLINNEIEKQQFPKHAKNDRAIVVLGAVDFDRIKEFKKLYPKHYTLNTKIYDAVFQGRFHPQKGVVELVDIWKKVVDRKPDAKLVMIGDGSLRKNVELRIKNLGLEKNIILTGYLFDGEEKYRIFAQSKIVVHPAFYDSGGMASAEAMAFGLPCVGFDLSSYKYYYPKGMVKVEVGQLDAFADQVVELLDNEKVRGEIGKEGEDMIYKNWSWDNRAKEVLSKILKDTRISA